MKTIFFTSAIQFEEGHCPLSHTSLSTPLPQAAQTAMAFVGIKSRYVFVKNRQNLCKKNEEGNKK